MANLTFYLDTCEFNTVERDSRWAGLLDNLAKQNAKLTQQLAELRQDATLEAVPADQAGVVSLASLKQLQINKVAEDREKAQRQFDVEVLIPYKIQLLKKLRCAGDAQAAQTLYKELDALLKKYRGTNLLGVGDLNAAIPEERQEKLAKQQLNAAFHSKVESLQAALVAANQETLAYFDFRKKAYQQQADKIKAYINVLEKNTHYLSPSQALLDQERPSRAKLLATRLTEKLRNIAKGPNKAAAIHQLIKTMIEFHATSQHSLAELLGDDRLLRKTLKSHLQKLPQKLLMRLQAACKQHISDAGLHFTAEDGNKKLFELIYQVIRPLAEQTHCLPCQRVRGYTGTQNTIEGDNANTLLDELIVANNIDDILAVINLHAGAYREDGAALQVQIDTLCTWVSDLSQEQRNALLLKFNQVSSNDDFYSDQALKLFYCLHLCLAESNQERINTDYCAKSIATTVPQQNATVPQQNLTVPHDFLSTLIAACQRDDSTFDRVRAAVVNDWPASAELEEFFTALKGQLLAMPFAEFRDKIIHKVLCSDYENTIQFGDVFCQVEVAEQECRLIENIISIREIREQVNRFVQDLGSGEADPDINGIASIEAQPLILQDLNALNVTQLTNAVKYLQSCLPLTAEDEAVDAQFFMDEEPLTPAAIALAQQLLPQCQQLLAVKSFSEKLLNSPLSSRCLLESLTEAVQRFNLSSAGQPWKLLFVKEVGLKKILLDFAGQIKARLGECSLAQLQALYSRLTEQDCLPSLDQMRLADFSQLALEANTGNKFSYEANAYLPLMKIFFQHLSNHVAELYQRKAHAVHEDVRVLFFDSEFVRFEENVQCAESQCVASVAEQKLFLEQLLVAREDDVLSLLQTQLQPLSESSRQFNETLQAYQTAAALLTRSQRDTLLERFNQVTRNSQFVSNRHLQFFYSVHVALLGEQANLQHLSYLKGENPVEGLASAAVEELNESQTIADRLLQRLQTLFLQGRNSQLVDLLDILWAEFCEFDRTNPTAQQATILSHKVAVLIPFLERAVEHLSLPALENLYFSMSSQYVRDLMGIPQAMSDAVAHGLIQRVTATGEVLHNPEQCQLYAAAVHSVFYQLADLCQQRYAAHFQQLYVLDTEPTLMQDLATASPRRATSVVHRMRSPSITSTGSSGRRRSARSLGLSVSDDEELAGGGYSDAFSVFDGSGSFVLPPAPPPSPVFGFANEEIAGPSAGQQ